jgi:hypothetical protein
MPEDEPRPPLTRWLEDDWSPQSDDELLRERRADRRRRSASRETLDREFTRARPRRERRSRVVAVIVLVLVAAAIAVTGVAAKQPVFGGAGAETVPFSLVPITGGATPSETGPSTTEAPGAGSATSTSTATTSTTVASTAGPGAPGAGGGSVGDLTYVLR